MEQTSIRNQLVGLGDVVSVVNDQQGGDDIGKCLH